MQMACHSREDGGPSSVAADDDGVWEMLIVMVQMIKPIWSATALGQPAEADRQSMEEVGINRKL